MKCSVVFTEGGRVIVRKERMGREVEENFKFAPTTMLIICLASGLAVSSSYKEKKGRSRVLLVVCAAPHRDS